MSSKIITVPLMDALVMCLWDGHTISMLMGRCKNLWTKICEKNREKNRNFYEKTSLELIEGWIWSKKVAYPIQFLEKNNLTVL